MRLRVIEKFCNDGMHEVPVVKVTDQDHKRIYVNLACGHSDMIYVGRDHKGPAPEKAMCVQCLDDCRACDEDFPQIDAFTEVYTDFGGGA